MFAKATHEKHIRAFTQYYQARITKLEETVRLEQKNRTLLQGAVAAMADGLDWYKNGNHFNEVYDCDDVVLDYGVHAAGVLENNRAAIVYAKQFS